MDAVKRKIKETLPAFRHRNFRLFWVGQGISLIGTQMQMVAMGWLIYRVTSRASDVQYVNAVGTLPILLLAMLAGMLADRVDKRRMLLATQVAFLVQASILAWMVYTLRIQVWSMYVLAAMQGAIFAFEAPVRQSFVSEMVPKETIVSAVALNSSIFNGARVVGGAIAGFLVHYTGEAGCFLVNALSYASVIIGILMMRESELFRTDEKVDKRKMGEALRYVAGDRRALSLLCTLGAVSIFGMSSFMFLPVFAKDILHVGARGNGVLFSAVGAGAMFSTLSLATGRGSHRQGLKIMCFGVVFAVCAIAFSLSRNYLLSMALLAVAGAGLTAALSLTNSTLQLVTPKDLRGLVMGIFVMVVVGIMPIGGFLLGTAARFTGAATVLFGSSCTCLALLAATALFLPEIISLDEKPTEEVSAAAA